MTEKRIINASRIQKAIIDYNMKEQSKLSLEQKRLEAFRMRLSLCRDLSKALRISYYGNPTYRRVRQKLKNTGNHHRNEARKKL